MDVEEPVEIEPEPLGLNLSGGSYDWLRKLGNSEPQRQPNPRLVAKAGLEGGL